MSPEERETDITQYEDLVDNKKCAYIENRPKLQKRIGYLTKQEKMFQRKIDNINAKATISIPSVNTSTKPEQNFTYLPQVKLPTFDGEITKWNSFWERYSHAIHDVNHIPPVLIF